MKLPDEDLRHAYNETYRRLTDGIVKHLVFDFSRLDYFGFTFIGMMIRLAKRSRQGGGEAVLCSINDNMQSMLSQLMLLENTQTDFFWKPFESREATVEWLQTAGYECPV